MKTSCRTSALGAAIVTAFLISANVSYLYAKHKEDADQNGPTVRLFQLLDSTRNGKLEDFYLLADLYKEPDKEPGKPNQEFRHILRVEYDKARAFGKLNLRVRSVAQMTDDQLSAYTLKQIYDFGEVDVEKFVKTGTGSFGSAGDVYLRSVSDAPLASAPVTDETRKEYDTFVNQYILPALQKK
jgi:hypothetical protein